MLIKNIKRLMDENGVNALQLSKAIGVSYSTVLSQIKGEVDEKNISVNTVIKMAKFFGVTVECLLAEEPQNKKAPAPAEPETEEQIKERAAKLYHSLIAAGWVKPGEDITDAQLAALDGIAAILDAIFNNSN